MASVIVIWRLTGSRLTGPNAERRAQQLVAVSFYLLGPYIAAEAILGLFHGDRPETNIIGPVLTAGAAILEPRLGFAKRRIGTRLGRAATAGEGTQNLLCAYPALAVFAGLLANAVFGAWWLDGAVAVDVAGWAVIEGRRAGKAVRAPGRQDHSADRRRGCRRTSPAILSAIVAVTITMIVRPGVRKTNDSGATADPGAQMAVVDYGRLPRDPCT